MFDIGWTELMVIGVVALIVIGPKELPNALRTVGRYTGKARAMTRHLRSGFDEMMRQAELEEMEKQWAEHNRKIMAEAPVVPDYKPTPAAPASNSDAPAAMARECAALGIPFVHISTDYVFDGAGSAPFAPDHPTAPLGAYGRSKLAGETGVRAAGGVHAILRTSWVFSAHGTNFLKTMLRLGRERASLTVVADQIGGPTPAHAIAAACLTIAQHLAEDPAKSGTYHFSGAPDASWADFAREIMARAGLACTITDIPTSAFPTPARRPANSRMNCDSLATFGLSRPDWKTAVTTALQELGAIT